MKNLKIGKKLIVTFAIILVMYLVTVSVALAGLSFGGEQFKDFYEYAHPMAMETLEARRGIQNAIKAMGLSLLNDDPATVQHYISELDEQITAVRNALNQLLTSYRGDTSNIEKALSLLDVGESYRIKIQDLATANQNSKAADIFFNQYNPVMLEVQDIIRAMDAHTDEIALETYETSSKAQLLIIIIAIAVSVVVFIITIVLAVYLTRALTRPIAEIKNAVEQVAQGNLDTTVTYESKDELGQLSISIRVLVGGLKGIIGDVDFLLGEMADGNFAVKSKIPEKYIGNFVNVLESMRTLRNRLSDTLTQINVASDQVAAGSDQVSSGAQALSQGATEQAASVEELAATIAEISNHVKDNAQNAQQGSELAEDTGAKIEEANRQMQEMIVAMADISEKSGQIGKIIKTIEDIAFQTNILALNAAVEAARAGAAGKGFAVVADEVRNLASKSAEASKSTAALIEGSIQAVEKGTHLADETAATLTKVVESAHQVLVVVENISQASNNQASSIAQVTQGVDQISGVVQTNSATAEESAAASEELSGQSQVLKNLVSQFQLADSNAQQHYTHAAPFKSAVPQFATSGKY